MSSPRAATSVATTKRKLGASPTRCRKRPDARQIEPRAPEVVRDATRRADDDIDAMFERCALALHRGAAGERQDSQVRHRAREATQLVGDLLSQARALDTARTRPAGWRAA